MISVSCSCGRKFKADDQHAGKRTRCPVCGNMLVIGQVVGKAPSNVSDNGEMPSWWFPSESPAKAPSRVSPPPTRSGSDPDDVQTVVIPSHVGSHPEIPSQGSAGARENGNTKITVWLICAGLACVVAGIGTILWLQSSGKSRGADGAGPQGSAQLVPGLKTDGEPPQADLSAPGETNPRVSDNVEETLPSTPVVSSTPRLQVLVPAYFYPSGPGLKAWQHLIVAASKIKIVAIANPSSGPGEQRNPDYYRIIQSASDKGIKVVGYVSTKYGNRSLAEIEKDIDRWVEYYPQVAGFFIDQQSSSADEVEFYLKIRDHARLKTKNVLVINNPGTMCDENYFARSVADVTCIFAGFEGLDQLKPPLSLKRYSPSRFAALAYQIPDAKAMRQAIKDAIVKRIGYLYISNSPKGDNPWAELPVYWDDEVEAISQID
jgi:Spherulation-specific family 4